MSMFYHLIERKKIDPLTTDLTVSRTAWKVFVFGVILIRIQSEFGKIRTKITPNTDMFYVVLFWTFLGNSQENAHMIKLVSF